MAYQPQAMYAAREMTGQPQSMYNARNDQYINAARNDQYTTARSDQYGDQRVNEKLLPGPYIGAHYEEEDEESERYYSDEAEDLRWYNQPLVKWTCCGVLALSILVLLFLRSLGGEAEGPTMTPPKMVVKQAAPAPPPQVLTQPPVVTAAKTTPVVMPVATAAATTRNPLLPSENRHDRNVCLNAEEEYAGLCYKKCALLTQGTHSIRTSSWTCCEHEPCSLGNTKGAVGTTLVCNGYDIGGDGNCPHEPGACLTNEELLLGVCYKQCSVLTQGAFPTRVGPATCCKSNDLLGCLNVRNDMTDPEFNIGGGSGDHDAATPNSPHTPLANLTESSKSVAALTAAVQTTLAPGAGGHVPADVACLADEELYAGLCYKKCSLLTQGGYSIRTSSWTCCQNHPCGLSNQKGSVGHAVVCNGYDVGGASAVKLGSLFACPHKPIGCDTNEEMLLGMCYTRCSLLTDNQFPFRMTAATCCKEKGIRACLDIRKVATSSNFNVGILT